MRVDISDYLIHFTKGDNHEKAYQTLKEIIRCGYLLGTCNKIKGGHMCVCFSEAPIEILADTGLVNPDYYSRYSPFGVMIKKDIVFKAGGRPVIYEPEDEYEPLPESHSWRHVTYNLSSEEIIDFTWEREWRIKTKRFDIDPGNTKIVVLDEKWKSRIINEHAYNVGQDRVREYAELLGIDEWWAQHYVEPFPWEIVKLR